MNKYFALAALIFSVPPPGGDGSFHLREDDGDGVNGDDHHGDRLDDIGQLTNPHQEKFSLQVLYPAPAGNATGLRQKDDGGRDVGRQKNVIASGPLPPAPAGEERDSGKRTMGWG